MIFYWKKIVQIVLFALLLTLQSHLVFAQSVTDTTTVPDDLSGTSASLGFDVGPTIDDLVVTMTPENPGAFQKVDLKVSSDYINLSRYQISWFVDGNLVLGGIGKQSITTATKDYGVSTTILLVVKLADKTLQKKIVLSPEDTSVLWEAMDSYAPPFYQGKKLPSREGIVKVIAIPNFSNTKDVGFDPKTGIYGWQRNDLPVPNVGGYGKDSFIFQHNKIRGTEKISVTAQDLDGSHQAVKDLTVSFFDPKILFYERNPITGIKDLLAKNQISLSSKETTIEAVPYFFSVLKNNPSGLDIKWTMNGQPITLVDAGNKTSLTIQKPNTSGSATLIMSADNTTKLFQSAKQQLRLVFTN